ncbi:uncharacterized protein LOC128546760 [Mercenaria mercenaria]|uniref:uncharacterized protein LOC128546760 n=1 Tax=Mercenaria mercenaria TaxID=6596 RepID=UPI00234EF8CE|nr:uncharacterized protein LOC128546760 [Mercenaria mercenaria]
MGLTTSPRVFTKVMKPVFASLRAKGHISSAYIDDSCLQGSTFTECQTNVSDTVELMDSLGLTVHPTKSVLIPCKQITFLGFILCSETMSIRLTSDRQEELISLSYSVLSKKSVTIRLFAKLKGKMVAAEPGVEAAPLFYKPLEKIKDKCIKIAKGDFDNYMKIPSSVRSIISWWISHLPTSKKQVSHGQPEYIIYSDASKKGYGAINKTTNTSTNGQWSLAEQNLHINILELKACQLALTSLCKDTNQCHIRIFMDNSTSCAYINKFGGKTDELNNLARDIWLWCIDKNIFVSAAHVAGSENNEADTLSRKFNDDLEWTLKENIFRKIRDQYPNMSVDLFASRLNHKLEKYVSYSPEANSYATDAFTLHWVHELYYIFSPFSLIPKILQKLEEEQSEAVMVCPIWPTQVWWASLTKLICGQCFLLPNPQNILYLPHKPDRIHPLKKMRLGVFRLSGNRSKAREYQQKQSTSYYSHGVIPPKHSTTHILKNGLHFVGSASIPFDHL